MNYDDHCDSYMQNFPPEQRNLDPNDAPFVESMPDALLKFKRALGYDLRFVKPCARRPDEKNDPNADSILVGSPNEKVYGALRLEKTPTAERAVDYDDARALAVSVADLLAENFRWRDSLAERDAALAAVAARPSDFESQRRAERPRAQILRDALRSGALALGNFAAAALYILDDNTTKLQTAAIWRLPDDRLLAPPRPLRGARAEVEALLGAAVVINSEELAEEWKAPEIFPCGVCIPIATNATILGVAWFFNNTPRKIGPRETEILDLVAKNIAAEIERDELAQQTNSKRDRYDKRLEDEKELEAWFDEVFGVDDDPRAQNDSDFEENNFDDELKNDDFSNDDFDRGDFESNDDFEGNTDGNTDGNIDDDFHDDFT